MAAEGEDEDPREESIKVCCRFRPQNQMERENHGKICVEVPDTNPSTSVYVPNGDLTFVYDRVFPWDASQKEVYDYAAMPIINSVLRGFNGTVFAYGQTSSGKTYTMEGPDIEDKVYQGVIPRMVWSIFNGIFHADENIEFLVRVSIVEIYNERIRDLLDPKKDNLKVHEDKARGVFIGEVTETYVSCEQEIFDAMRAGHFNRAMAVTNMNEHSSRSHLVFMLTIEQKDLHDRSVKVGKLHLVDLAGSEKVAKTGASGERLDEAKNINRSLSALGNVINALTDKKSTHVPYRDSKLTRVLQESLGGNAKTSLIITCSPSNFNEQETISTLRFGQRAKMIKNVVKVNHERSAEELKLALEKKELIVEEQRTRLSAYEQLLKSHGIQLPEDMASIGGLAAAGAADLAGRVEHDELRNKVQELRDQVKGLREEDADKNAKLHDMQQLVRCLVEEKNDLQSQLMDAKMDREKVEYERNEKAHEVESLRTETSSLRTALEEMQGLQIQAVSTNAVDGSPREAEPARVATPALAGGGMQPEDRAVRHADPPLKRKVPALDRKIEQLTSLYHKLVTQHSDLKVDKEQNEKTIQRKDVRIGQLEKNLREAKQKYEKLLQQCANLTAAMDSMGHGKAAGGALADGTAASSSQVRRNNIVRPVRGASGVIRYDLADVHGGYPAEAAGDSPGRSRRDNSRTPLSRGVP
uniref:Kinesin-like protein n=1 Tax=Alexandrium monilatum TaxID=311494 RepID=A0A7S4V310_9DINO|mmetsp:Transcript_24092/g.75529  ORF Transcript_24092/g.75529 Transcript_24092/m.75529 type:complete len:697 (+) Transcript_24092:123-2213(+)